MRKITLILMLIIQFEIFCKEKYFIPVITEGTKYVNKKEKLNYKNDEQIKSIFRDIFDLHFDTWKQEFKREINLNEKVYNEIDTTELDSNKVIEEEKLNKSLDILKNIIKSNKISLPYAEACFKLALFSYVTNKLDAEKSREILDNGLKVSSLEREDKKLFIRMNLLAGSLSLSREKFVEAKKYYSEIFKLNLDPEQFREEIIRAYIGFGDSEFEQYHFSEAHILYKKGLFFSKNFIGYNENKYALLIGEIKLRLLWSSYRNADYKLATEYAQDFAREKGRYDSLMPKNVVEDVIRVGALSLYERKDINFYKILAQDRAAGDFAKKMIINSFYSYISAGYSAEVEKYAKLIESQFYSSRLLPDFIKARLIALNKENNIDKYNELSYYGSAFIAKNSLWKSRFILSEIEEENRRTMIYNFSLQAGNYYYNLGINTKSRTDFLKSAEIYYARIQENYEGDLRGVLFQSYAQSLMMAGDYKLAWDASEESLKQPLKEEYLKVSWYQLVNISRLQSEDTLDTKSAEFKKYEKAVDGYITHFPTDPQARLSLFESAKRAELLNDYENARDRYEKILSSPPLYFKEQSQEEKDKVSLSLANLYIKMGAKEKEIPDAAGSLEKISSENKISETVQKVVTIANYSLAVEYAKKLKERGDLVNSAKFLELWSKNYSNNPSSGEAMILSIKEFATIQNWNHVQALSLYFIHNKSSNKMLNEAVFWQARSSDMLLQFSLASSLYDKSSYNDDAYPLVEQKIFALKRGAEIYQLLLKEEDAARLLEKLSILKVNSKDGENEIAKIELNSAQKYFNLKQYKMANKIYQKILNRKFIDKNMKENANLGVLSVQLYLNKNRNMSENKFDKYIKNILNEASSNKSSNLIDIANKAIVLVNTFDNEQFDFENSKNFSNISLVNINNMDLSRNYMAKRLLYLKKISLSNEYLVHINTLLGKMSAILGDTYVQYYKKRHKKDVYLITANQLQTEAKKYLYEALSSIENNSQESLLLSSLLSRYSKREFRISPEAKIQDSQDPSFILEYLPMSFSITKQVDGIGGLK